MFSISLFIILSLLLSCSSFSLFKLRSKRNINLQQQLKAEVKEDIAAEKLVYDESTNRFYESIIEQPGSVVDEYFIIDKETGDKIYLTREEKERIFLDSIQSYYYNGAQQLNDEDFNKLREDLSWEGSALVTLNRNETLFVNAIQAYNKGKPILSDTQFDELKSLLKESNSKIAVFSEPKCYVDTGLCKVTWSPDTVRTASLYVPATLFTSVLYLGLSYEFLGLLNIGINPIIALIIGSYPLYTASKSITEQFLFKDPFVASGKCPKCGVENRVFFGDVLGVEGDKEQSAVKCTNCKTGMTVKRSTLRVSTLPSNNVKAAVAKSD